MARLGLRPSVTAGFALGALVLSVALALGTYLSARHLLIEQRERTALRQAFSDAALVGDSLQTSGADVSETLGSLSLPAGTIVYLHSDGEWYSTSLDVPAEPATAGVREAVGDGRVVTGWTAQTEPPAVVVGIPLRAVDAEYYEVAVADELDQTLGTLTLALGTGAALTTAGGALLGWWASRRLLSPLTDVTRAAAQISGGDLDTRLRETEDADLAALVGAFNNMVDTLDDKIAQEERFAADVAHEMRTPVTTLTNCLELLRRARDLPDTAVHAVDLMSTELDRFTRALEDLLALGRLDSGSGDSPPTVMAVDELVRHALRGTGRDPALLVTPADAPDGLSVTGHAPQLVRVLTNLFDNADIHGDGLVRVRVESTALGVEVHVEDAGRGVGQEDRERIFERFARVGARRAGTGSGLGLSIVARTVRNHGGSVWCAESSLGGADMVVRLPSWQGDRA